MKNRVEQSKSYQLTKSITYAMDRCFLDPILGFFPGLDSLIGVFCTSVFVYVSMVKVRSVPLTLAIIYNFLQDTAIGLIPFFIGDVLDFFNRSYVKSQYLIDGFVNGDKEVIKTVNRQAVTMGLLSLLCIAVIALLVWLVWITGGWMFSTISQLIGNS